MTDNASDADFTPNPARAIRVDGWFNEALLERLRPEILDLTAHNRDPITVFIDSVGGTCSVGEEILRLLRRTTTEDGRTSRIITVAAPKAASAAAELLSAGDFAIARPESELLYHGTHWLVPGPWIAPKEGKLFRQILPTLHERAAAALARNCVRRFLFIVSAKRMLFAQHRAAAGDPAMTDMECFQAILRGKLSPAGQKALDLAILLWDSHNGLLLHFQKRLRRRSAVTKAHLQKLMLYSSIDFEYESNEGSPAWDGGLSRISDHFFFLNDYFDIEKLCDWVADREPQSAHDSEDVEGAYFLPFRFFFLALCRALQEGENYVTATDALWLGLVDTVREETGISHSPALHFGFRAGTNSGLS